MAATPSGAHPERNLFHYRNRLRELFGSGRFRIERDGRIRVLSGDWQTWGRVGDPQTVALLFPRQRGVVAVTYAMLLAFTAVAVTGCVAAVDAGIRSYDPTIGFWDIVGALLQMAVAHIQAARGAA